MSDKINISFDMINTNLLRKLQSNTFNNEILTLLNVGKWIKKLIDKQNEDIKLINEKMELILKDIYTEYKDGEESIKQIEILKNNKKNEIEQELSKIKFEFDKLKLDYDKIESYNLGLTSAELVCLIELIGENYLLD